MSQFRILDYNYVFADIDITPTSEATSFPASNLQKFSRSKVYRSAGVEDQRIVFDLYTPSLIDTIVVLFDRQSDILISPGATFKVEAHPTNSWTSPDFSESLTIDDTNHCATKYLSSAEEYRFWSIFVDDPANAIGYFELAKVLLGKATQLSQIPSMPLEVQSIDQSLFQDSPYGIRFSDAYPYRRMASFPHRMLPQADKQTLSEIYNRCGKIKPIALCLDPNEQFFNDGNEHLFYGYLDNDFRSVNGITSYFDVDVTIKEAL